MFDLQVIALNDTGGHSPQIRQWSVSIDFFPENNMVIYNITMNGLYLNLAYYLMQPLMPDLKPQLRCRKCNNLFHYRKKTTGIMKAIFLFFPIKAFFCAKCLTTGYRILSDKRYQKYEQILWLRAIS
ncbi:hypothetical protein EOD41_14975 [Mucilaginibacter limnophilus]|uniref:Zinc-ribbon domain-containing protein n=1 Tax=Mucilaginibacter limnophilus TaxID=1932778 RepID=A0A437MQ58_9SPHI|nr:hypothetical protein [Mucilaginibacter limnophilus]RVT99745.1 hypothetical protein EOD41_14975 [Mucilaginibacter limnophilus]